jgi:hypothetical protein
MHPLVLLVVAAVLAGCSTVSAPREAAAPPTPPSAPSASASAPAPAPVPSPQRTRVEPPPPRALATDPAGLAAQIVEAEEAIRDPELALADLAELGQLQQWAYRRLARTPEWKAEVLAAVPPGLRDTVRANADAVAGTAAMVRPLPAGSRPSWRIASPAPADDLLGHYREAEKRFGIGWEYLAAIHLVETRMGRIQGTSYAGAQGPMQFMPGTWAQYGEGDVYDNRDAILAAGRYLRAMGGPADMSRALRRYNNSASYVRAVQGHAAVLRAELVAYRGYYHWQVHYLTEEGDLVLPEGFPERPAVAPPA